MTRIILLVMVVVQIVYSIVFVFSISASHVTGSANTITIPSNLSSDLIYFPKSEGYVNGKIAHFIATDTSDNETAIAITDNLGYEVNYAPNLVMVPESARQQG
jgi:presenilin-like A22 family membrane protease